MKHHINIMLAAATLIVASDGLAQSQMASPSVQASRGQSQAQQSRDMDRCNLQARKQTGVDPISIAANATPLQQGKGITSVPIEAPSSAMGSSAAGATSAGTGDMGTGGQMGNSASGQMTNAGSGQMATGAGQMGNAGTAQTGTATSNSDWATGASSGGMSPTGAAGSGASGASASGTTGSSGNTVAMADSADVYNQAFSKCMSSHGYVVGNSQ